MGACTLLRPWVVSRYGGLFHVRCEKGDAAILRLAVRRNGTISEATLLPSHDHYRGPPVADAPPRTDEQSPARSGHDPAEPAALD